MCIRDRGFPVQAAKALVDEQGVKPHRAGVVLHHVGKPKGQGQGGQKLLPAGQCFNGPGQHGGAVQHFQVQPAQGVAPLGALHQAQGVAAPAEGGEKPVGAEKQDVYKRQA